MALLKIIFIAGIIGAFLFAVARRARQEERAKAAQALNKTIKEAQHVKNEISRDPDKRRRVREHFDAR